MIWNISLNKSIIWIVFSYCSCWQKVLFSYFGLDKMKAKLISYSWKCSPSLFLENCSFMLVDSEAKCFRGAFRSILFKIQTPNCSLPRSGKGGHKLVQCSTRAWAARERRVPAWFVFLIFLCIILIIWFQHKHVSGCCALIIWNKLT